MAKVRQANSIVSAIQSVTAALRLESIPNPTEEQKLQIHNAKVEAADCIDGSNFVTLGDNADDAIELQHQIAEEQEQEAIEEGEGDNTPILPPDADDVFGN